MTLFQDIRDRFGEVTIMGVFYHPVKDEITIVRAVFPYFEFCTYHRQEIWWQWSNYDPIQLGFIYIGELE